MNLLIMTIRFLTRIPIPSFGKEEILETKEFAKGVIWYPVIGLLVGACNCFIFFLAGMVSTSWGFPAVCSVLMNILITGAFHLDGLADTCDGLFSSRKKERMLEIMRDSRVGTNGVIAIVFDILFRVVLIQSMAYDHIFPAILLAPVAGKMATPILFGSKYARKEEGLGNIYLGNVSEKRLGAAILIGAFFILIFLGYNGILPIICSLLGMIIYRRYVEKKIDGMTGDTLGAGAELIEILFFVVMMAGRGY